MTISEQSAEKKKGFPEWINLMKPGNEEKDHWVCLIFLIASIELTNELLYNSSFGVVLVVKYEDVSSTPNQYNFY